MAQTWDCRDDLAKDARGQMLLAALEDERRPQACWLCKTWVNTWANWFSDDCPESTTGHRLSTYQVACLPRDQHIVQRTEELRRELHDNL